jgi:hypothetical protein
VCVFAFWLAVLLDEIISDRQRCGLRICFKPCSIFKHTQFTERKDRYFLTIYPGNSTEMRMGEERRVCRVLVGKTEGKRPLGRPRRWWVDNIRMDLQEVGCGYMDWIGLAQDRDRWRTIVSAVMNLRVPWNAGNFLTSCKPVSCSRRTLHHGVSE